MALRSSHNREYRLIVLQGGSVQCHSFSSRSKTAPASSRSTTMSKRNALSRALIDELIAALEEIKAAAARSVILRAHPGATVWSAGHDVAELPGPGRDPLGYEDPLRRVVRAIETLPLPVIAMIEGSVWGGACELAITCDLVIATPDATFALTPAKLGVPYNTAGILNMMSSISMPLLKEMLFTARPISSERALHLGMINYVVPAPTSNASPPKSPLSSPRHRPCASLS